MTPLIVTGMHRSGTSAVARMLQRLGAGLGTHLLGPSSGNVHGHFEEMAFVAFHIALIKKYAPRLASGCDWLPLAMAAPAYDKADLSEASLLWQHHRAQGGTAWKDPRTSLFLDLWLRVLPEARVVLCLRHPYEVHRSLLRRGELFLITDYAAGLRGWALYNERILLGLAGLPGERLLRVEVDDFADPMGLAGRMARFAQTPDAAPSGEAAGAIDPEQLHCVLDAEGRRQFAAWFPELEALSRRLRGRGGMVYDPDGVTAHPLEARLDEFEKRYGLREETLHERARYVEQVRRGEAA